MDALSPATLKHLHRGDVSPLKVTLERFDRIITPVSVGAVNVRAGNFVCFDTITHRIAPAHIIASGSLPAGFSATDPSQKETNHDSPSGSS